jgi:hypothetical protein
MRFEFLFEQVFYFDGDVIQKNFDDFRNTIQK